MVARAPSYSMRVIEVRDCKPKPYYRTKPQHRSVGVEVEITATSGHRVPANPFYAHLVDSKGREHRAQLGGCEKALAHRPLARGAAARGFITFEIPEDESNLKLRYAPFILDAGSQELVFDLGG